MTWTFPAARLKGMTRLNAEGHGCWRCQHLSDAEQNPTESRLKQTKKFLLVSRHSRNTYKAYSQPQTIKTIKTLQCACKGSSHSCWRVAWCGITARSVPDFREDEPDPILPGGCEITYRGGTAALKRLLFEGTEERPVRKRQLKGEGGGDLLNRGFSAVFPLTRSPAARGAQPAAAARAARKPGQEGSAASVETVPS